MVRAVRRRLRCELVYYADLAGYPYGARARGELARIISGTLADIRGRFRPDAIVMASNTPTLLLGEPPGVIGIYPPAGEAARLSRTGHIAVLTTASAARSRALARHLSGCGLPPRRVHRLDCSDLVDAVQSGRPARRLIGGLADRLAGLDVDVATLSSTHLALLRAEMERGIPGVAFLDPAESAARRAAEAVRPSRRASMRIYANADPARFERALRRLGVRHRVRRVCTRG